MSLRDAPDCASPEFRSRVNKHAQLLMSVLRIEFGFPCLHGEYFTNLLKGDVDRTGETAQ